MHIGVEEVEGASRTKLAVNPTPIKKYLKRYGGDGELGRAYGIGDHGSWVFSEGNEEDGKKRRKQSNLLFFLNFRVYIFLLVHLFMTKIPSSNGRKNNI